MSLENRGKFEEYALPLIGQLINQGFSYLHEREETKRLKMRIEAAEYAAAMQCHVYAKAVQTNTELGNQFFALLSMPHLTPEERRDVLAQIRQLLTDNRVMYNDTRRIVANGGASDFLLEGE